MCQYLIRGSGAGGPRISRIQELRLFSALGIHCDGTARTSCSSIPGCTCSVHSNATLVALPRGCCTYSVHCRLVATALQQQKAKFGREMGEKISKLLISNAL